MDIRRVLLSNYMPYAKGTIIGRAIPSIDGLKPAHRRILYTMNTMHLINGDKTKSSNIVGQTMKLHPHGDSAIYETMVRMATGNESLNAPYVESKGNFGKTYSKSLAYAAPRYTEAKLAPICKEIFDGIDEDAVIMTDNFDNTTKEPTLLPVKFPSILVNPSNGIAVGMASAIPSFSLTNVCNATIGIIKGEITDASSLMDVLGVPEYTTGGYIHASKEDLVKLGETGKGSFIFSGTVNTYSDRIEILEIPYNTTAEDIVAAIEEHAKAGDLKEVTKVSDEIDLKGFKLVVKLKKNSNPKAVLQKICRLTPLRKSISYNTRVIIGDRCEEIGLYDLLWKWIEFRVQVIDNIHKFRKNKAEKEAHLLEAWEKINGKVRDVTTIISSYKEAEAFSLLMSTFGLDEQQANYIMDMRLKMISQDNVAKKLKELAEKREIISNCAKIIASDQEKYKLIVIDLQRIIKEYGGKNRTHRADPIVEVQEPAEETKIDDSIVNVIMTKSGFLKRLVSLRDMTSFQLPEGEEEAMRWTCHNNEHVLVFTYEGNVHKILVNDIDAGRGGLKDEIYKIVGLQNNKSIMLVDISGDYSRYFNLVYPNGRGTRVYYNRAQGNRKRYKGLFEPCEKGKVWVTFDDQFFMITAKRKAAYCNLELMGMFSNRVAFKVARVNSGDSIWGLQPARLVPNLDAIDLDKYNKDYTVCINEDVLWKQAEEESEDTAQDGEVNETEDTPVEEVK